MPQGVSISTLEAALAADGIRLNRRTLLRRLQELLDQNRIVAGGRRKGRIYRFARPTELVAALPDVSLISLSAEAKEIEAYVRRPVQGREPIGYQRDFLLGYLETGPYLDNRTCQRLHALGTRQHGPVRPAGTEARQILGRLLIDLSWASSRLEGNTYSLLETERLLSFGEEATGKDAIETQMILNHKQAIEFLVESAQEVGFNRHTILNLHALLSDGLLSDPGSCGRLRQMPVGIGGSVYSPLSTPQLVEEYFQRVLDTAAAIVDPFEQSFFALVHLPYLQPFEDVNKRVSRLSANIPLIRHNLCPLSFIDVPDDLYVAGMLGVYELNRVELLREVFVWGYERSVKRYMAAREEFTPPDPIRQRHRQALMQLIGQVVRGRITESAPFITKWAEQNIPEADRERFVEIAQQEMDSLHEGNIARFRLTGVEFVKWRRS
ncbi:MAG: Fic family protein [Desulfobulbaceae bacterium]|nr:Fic family protein [Desulfobulbaceae bacterium]